MDFRDYLEWLNRRNELLGVESPISKNLEISSLLSRVDKPILFYSVKESSFKVAGNIFISKEHVAEYFGLHAQGLIHKMLNAIESPTEPTLIENAPAQEVVEETVDLDKIPILFHYENDGGNYVTSGVFVSRDDEYGQNLDFHRAMQIGKNRFVIRVVENRDLDTYLKRAGGELDVAMCVGLPINILLAAALSVERDKDEMWIANSLSPTRVVKAKTVDLIVPADAEFIIEGRIIKEKVEEGPFVDLTGTYDIVREQPVFEVRRITHRKDAIWHALMPGGPEHKLLMGMPREPTIFREVNKVAKCLDVYINPGGCSWLHAIVKIKKQRDDDGKRAIKAAFRGHRSAKHVFVVDNDINIYDPLDVEWALATRFQADRDMVIKRGERGSSLDPSADPISRLTTKVGFDLTKPLKEKEKFERVKPREIDLKKFLNEDE